MMVLRSERVECSAKIAMTALFNAAAATCLLPNYDPPRSIFLGVPVTRISSS
jgi:hypothetical protein